MDRVAQRRFHKRRDAEELEVTPFMNLMIVLVPVLLLSMVFTHTTIIDLHFPSGDSTGDFDPDAVHLEVIVRSDALVVGDGRGGPIKTLQKVDGQYDFGALSNVMQELKRRMPDKRDITILLERDTDYQTVVTVMDKVRSYKTLQAFDVVDAELFPEISLGDAPAPVAAAS
jgi:biopolymer transport protein ExbD